MIKNFSFDSVSLENRYHHHKNRSLEGNTNIDNFFKSSLNNIRVSSGSRQTAVNERSESTAGHNSTDETVNISAGGVGGKNSHRSHSSFLIGKKNREITKKPLSTFVAEKKTLLTLILTVGEKHHRLEFNILGRNTGWLRDQISSFFFGPADSNVVHPQFWLISKEENFLLDQYLHSRERSLSCLKEKTLELEILKQTVPTPSCKQIIYI
jgi:hypothetical protein